MDDETRRKYEEAGRIAATALNETIPRVAEGALLKDIAEFVEQRIRGLGGEVAFPACISINDIAAHYAPGVQDAAIVPADAVVKVDIGAHVDGFIGDTARTVDVGRTHEALVAASRAALAAAVEQCYTGNELGNVSAAIETAIREHGFVPITNLTGHGLAQFFLHESPTVPNVATNSTTKLKEGQVLAIEPFATNGSGFVKDSEPATIFRIAAPRPVRNPDARKIIEFAASIHGLPFSERWLPVESVFKLRMALRELREKEILVEYPALREAAHGLVSQAEHTIIIGDPPIVTTRV